MRTHPWQMTLKLCDGLNDLSQFIPHGSTFRQIVNLEVVSGELKELRTIPDANALHVVCRGDTLIKLLIDVQVGP